MLSGLRFRATLAADRLRALVSVPLECDVAGSPTDLAQRPSPPARLDFTVGGAPALLCYGRPAAGGRRIFGDLVPYGELWRLGANEPTTLHMPFAARIAGLRVRRGKLSLYAVPGEESWMLVLNRSTRQWGLTRPERGPKGRLFQSAYTPAVRSAELGRVEVETRDVPLVDRLTASTEVVDESTTLLLIEWETTQIRIPIER